MANPFTKQFKLFFAKSYLKPIIIVAVKFLKTTVPIFIRDGNDIKSQKEKEMQVIFFKKTPKISSNKYEQRS